MIIKDHFQKKGSALGLVLKQRFVASRKWAIESVIICQGDLTKLDDSQAGLQFVVNHEYE